MCADFNQGASDNPLAQIMSKRSVVSLPMTEARERLADVVIDVAFRNTRVVLRRHGRPLAVLVSMEDLARLEALDAEGSPASAGP